MVLLPVDESYAFDYLAILQVKRDNGVAVEAHLAQIETFLVAQVENFGAVMASAAYKRMLVANQLTFDAVEQAAHGTISARAVQQANVQRFRAKRRLQRQFWPNRAMTEKKTRNER